MEIDLQEPDWPKIKIFSRCLESAVVREVWRITVANNDRIEVVTLEEMAELVVHDDITQVFAAGEKVNQRRWYAFISSGEQPLFPPANVWFLEKRQFIDPTERPNVSFMELVFLLCEQLARRRGCQAT